MYTCSRSMNEAKLSILQQPNRPLGDPFYPFAFDCADRNSGKLSFPGIFPSAWMFNRSFHERIQVCFQILKALLRPIFVSFRGDDKPCFATNRDQWQWRQFLGRSRLNDQSLIIGTDRIGSDRAKGLPIDHAGFCLRVCFGAFELFELAEFVPEDLELLYCTPTAEVDDESEDLSPLDVAQEAQPQPFILMGVCDEARDVSYREFLSWFTARAAGLDLRATVAVV